MASPNVREANEGTQYQGEDESIAYTLDVSSVGSSPTNVAVEAKEVSDSYADVKATVMPDGSPTVSDNVITLPLLTALTIGSKYQIEVKFDISGNTFEVFFIVVGQR